MAGSGGHPRLRTLVLRPIGEGQLRHRLLAGLGIALALSTSLVPPALAGTLTVVDPVESAPAAVPGSEPGAMRDWVQLMWNPLDR